MDWAWLWVGESRLEPNIIPPNTWEWFQNSYSLQFRGCEGMVDRGELLGDYGVSPLLPREQPLLPLVLRDLVLGLKPPHPHTCASRFELSQAYYSLPQLISAYHSFIQHTTAYYSLVQVTTAYVSFLQLTSAYYNLLYLTTVFQHLIVGNQSCT